MKKQWNVTVEGEAYTVEIDLSRFLGKLTVSVNGEAFPLTPKFLTCLFGRRERFMLGDKLALLVIKPFLRADIVVGGKYVSSGEMYTG